MSTLTLEKLKAAIDELAPLREPIHLATKESVYLTVREQVRFPKSKRARIRKKWRKDRRNWGTKPDPKVYRVAGNELLRQPAYYLMHPDTAKVLRRAFELHALPQQNHLFGSRFRPMFAD